MTTATTPAKRIRFEGGPLDGQSFELPPGTVEILIASLMPGNDRYQIVVRDGGGFANWVGMSPGVKRRGEIVTFDELRKRAPNLPDDVVNLILDIPSEALEPLAQLHALVRQSSESDVATLGSSASSDECVRIQQRRYEIIHQ